MIDWPDAKAIEILVNIVKSMNAESRVLIYEMVVEPLHRQGPEYRLDEGKEGAPAILPPNYGGRWQSQKDLVMLNLLQGKQRNFEEWVELVGKAGLDVMKFWTVPGMESSIIECKKKLAAG